MVHDLQKANMWKRISAYIFDSILLITVAVGVAALLSGLFGYDTHTAERQRLRQDYETRYGVSFDVEWDSYEALPEEERQKVYDDADLDLCNLPNDKMLEDINAFFERSIHK